MNPFTSWLPMYGPDAVPERPWWRYGVKLSLGAGIFGTWPDPSRPVRDPDTFRRCDGLMACAVQRESRRIGWCLTDETMQGLKGRADGEAFATAEEAMAAADAHAPVSAPPPMVGQVWGHGDGARMITSIAEEDGSTTIRFDKQLYEIGEDPGGTYTIYMAWPPPEMVLVSGPTPWGRDVPWAPPGWTP